MSNEFRIMGNPGTGKTTKLATEIVPMLVEKYGENKVMITSFTKAAAAELGKKINSPNIGTLHSMCYKALKCPPLTEEHLKDWNESCARYSFVPGNKTGTELHTKYQIYRNKMINRTLWSKDVLRFADIWEEWKTKNLLLDFTDLIENAGELLTLPSNPAAIVADECQDFTFLEMSTLRQWATQCQEFWICGDPNQTIFQFSGASALNMLEPEIPAEQKIYLQQSYRIPASVHRVAIKVIERVTDRDTTPYNPKDIEGAVISGNGDFHDPTWMINKALKLDGNSMILASCNYMLDDITNQLKDRGIPFSNPWRKEAKNWNPLSTLGADMLISFLDTGEDEQYWDTIQFLKWAPYILVGDEGIIRKHGKAAIKQLQEIIDTSPDTPGLHTCREYIKNILTEIAFEKCLERDVGWLKEHITVAAKRAIKFPAQILKKQGRDALLSSPRIHPGTIHSVKGAGADNVFLYPDISFASVKEMEFKEGYDNLCRLFYVGITRAKENLILMPPATSNFFDI